MCHISLFVQIKAEINRFNVFVEASKSRETVIPTSIWALQTIPPDSQLHSQDLDLCEEKTRRDRKRKKQKRWLG